MSTKNELDLFFKKFEKGEIVYETDKFMDLENKPILIYGAGNVGRRLQKILSGNNLKIIGFLDRNKKLESLPSEVPIFHPENKVVLKYNKKATVIIAGLFDKQTRNEIGSYLSILGYIYIYQLNEIDFSQYIRRHCYENTVGNMCRRLNILEEEKVKINKAFDLLHGNKDKRCFIDFIKAHLTMDFLQLPSPDDLKHQYLAHDILYAKNYSNLIDCGGYDGDTVKNILSHNYNINNLIIFEPNHMLFQKIVSFLNNDQKDFQSAIALPCGVYSETRPLPFAFVGDDASTGHVDQSASNTIQCVKLDDLLHGFNPTFIKMDIEGAELEALKGAKQTVKKNLPQLAICVYHCLSHVWDIPLMINDLHGGYDLFLRSYNKMTMETVLYAFPNSLS